MELARVMEKTVKAKARERQLATLAQNQEPDTVKEIFPERQARDELGAMAGVSVKAKARERMTAGVNQYTESPVPNLAQGKARDELADMAGVGHTTYSHAAAVIESAPAPPIPLRLTRLLSVTVSE